MGHRIHERRLEAASGPPPCLETVQVRLPELSYRYVSVACSEGYCLCEFPERPAHTFAKLHAVVDHPNPTRSLLWLLKNRDAVSAIPESTSQVFARLFTGFQRTSRLLGCCHAAERLGGSPRLCFAPKVRAGEGVGRAVLPAGCRHAADKRLSGWAEAPGCGLHRRCARWRGRWWGIGRAVCPQAAAMWLTSG